MVKKCEFACSNLFDRFNGITFADYFISANQIFFPMKIIVSGLSVFMLTVSGIFAQSNFPVCGNTTADQVEHLLPKVRQYQSQVMTSERNDVQYVPMYFHLVADVNGEGRHLDRLVLDQLCKMNEDYAALDMRFYINAHPTHGLIDRSINSNTVYNGQTNEFLMNSRRHQNAINVYVVNNVFNDESVLGFFNNSRDWLVCKKNQINGNNNGTLAHEAGHYFSLPHTFLGYESNPFDGVNDPSWPIAPLQSPGGPFTEKVDGSNCQSAADEICDTPEDYNFGYGAPGGCDPYTGIAKDPNNQPVDPMENNFMGYFIGCANYQFTQGQMNIMLADRETPSRNYLDNSFSPIATAITVPDDLLISPIGGETQAFYDEVLVQWQPVPGANFFLLEFDISTFFSTPLYQSFILPATTTSRLMTTLLANRNYYWRVRPFNEYVTCEPGKTSTFRTPLTSGVKNIEGLNAWSVFPNPATSGNLGFIKVNAENGFVANLSVTDPAGQIVYEQRKVSIPQGESTLEYPLDGLANGVYFVALSTEQGRDVRKMTVLK